MFKSLICKQQKKPQLLFGLNSLVFKQRQGMASLAQLVKQLREETGSPMLQCKKALQDHDLDIKQAKEYLKKAGLSKASKYSSKETREGIVGIKVSEDSQNAAMLELNCQTDFVARTDSYLQFSGVLLNTLLQQQNSKNIELKEEAEINNFCENNVLNEKVLPQAEQSASIAEVQKQLISHLQENINMRRISRISTETGLYGAYVHNSLTSGIGLKSCLVELELSEVLKLENDQKKAVRELADNIALQILGNKPQYLTKSEIPEDILSKELEVAKASFGDKLAGKPEQIQNRMVEGKMKKFYEDLVLYSQTYLFDEDDGRTIEQLIQEVEKQVGQKISIKNYAQWSTQ